MTSPQRQCGVTLIELLITLLIFLTIFSVGIPSLTAFSERIEANKDISLIRQLLFSARTHAVIQQVRVRICPLDKSNKCHNHWGRDVVAFEDTNHNRRRDHNEAIIFQLKAPTDKRKSVLFNRTSISFAANGFSGGSNGTFTYCFNASKPYMAMLIIANTGRIRNGRDSNKNGIPEYPNRKEMRCP